MSKHEDPEALEVQEAPAFFVSRRGRQVGVHEVDLSGIDIESTNNGGAATAKQKAVKTAKVAKTERVATPRRGWTKKRKVILIFVVCVLVALPLLFGEFVTAQYRSGVTSAKQDLTRLVQTTVLPAQKKPSISADTVRLIANGVNETVGHMCRGGLLDNVADLYPRARTALGDCKQSQSRYAALAGSLYTLEAQTRYLEKVNALMEPVATPIADAYAVIGSQQTDWQSTLEATKKLSPPDSLRAAHGELISAVEAASTAWSELNTANNTRNATKFEASEQKLVTSYEAVRAVSEKFSQVLGDTQADILSDYGAVKS